MKIRVYYEDTDCAGIVYHASYIRFCERARSEIFLSRGYSFKDQVFVVVDLRAHFYQTAKLGDFIEVKTQVKELKKASLILNQGIYKEGDKIFEAEFRLGFVCIHSSKLMPIPQELKDILCKL